VHTRRQRTPDGDWDGYSEWSNPDGSNSKVAYYTIDLQGAGAAEVATLAGARMVRHLPARIRLLSPRRPPRIPLHRLRRWQIPPRYDMQGLLSWQWLLNLRHASLAVAAMDAQPTTCKPCDPDNDHPFPGLQALRLLQSAADPATACHASRPMTVQLTLCRRCCSFLAGKYHDFSRSRGVIFSLDTCCNSK